MKLEHIQADNFLRLNLLDVSLKESVVHLFAGDNEAGKSSVQECVRFALKGETLRVSNKGDYKLMIRDGAKSGTVGIILDGVDIVRDIKTGKPMNETMGDYLAQLPEYLPFLLDAQRFARQSVAVRRSFLINLTGISVDPDDIEKRMKAKGVHERCIDQVKSMLRSDIQQAYNHAVKQASNARAAWKGLTNTTYGSNIGEGWKPKVPEEYDPQALLDGEKGLGQLQEAIDAINVQKGGLAAKLEEAQKDLSGDDDAGTFDKDELDKLIRAVEGLESALADLNQKRLSMNTMLANAREKVPVTCCECGSMLRVVFSGKRVDVTPYSPMSEEEEAKLQASIIETGAEISDVESELRTQRAALATQHRLEAVSLGSGGKVTQSDIDAIKTSIATVNAKLAQLNDKHTALSEKVLVWRAAATLVTDAKKIEERAGSLHRGVQAWKACAATLAPDGIPAEILSDTLKPVNNRLRHTSIKTEWPQVTIDPTMEVLADGRRYSLLSESAKWRTDAAIADAIAHLSGLKLMVLDRFDVLDLKNRGACMRWISDIQGEYDTILIFGTLKQLPALPVTMEGHWIENGEIKEVV